MSFASAFSFLTEFGCGYVLLGCFSRFLNLLGMILLFGFCFRVLRFGWYAKNSIQFLCDYRGIPRFRFCFDNRVRQVPKSKKVEAFEKGNVETLSSPALSVTPPTKKGSYLSREKGSANSEDGWASKDEKEREVVDEDEVFDVMTLRKLVKTERRKANAACADLDKERTASSSSAEEAMAMILRLQSEKSSAEIEAKQFRRMAEERLEYDQEVIEQLHWVITDHQTQKGLVEDQLGIYREELKLFVTDEEINQLVVVGNMGVFGDDQEQDHSQVGNDPEPEHSVVVGDDPEPEHSVNGDDPGSDHSVVVGNDREPEHSEVGDYSKPDHSLVENHPKLDHSLVGDDPKPDYSVVGDDPEPVHSVVSSSQTES